MGEGEIGPTLAKALRRKDDITSTQHPNVSELKKPTMAFLLTLTGGTITTMFSSSIFPYTQSFFISSTFFQNSFLLGIVLIFTGALLHERPSQRLTWGTTIVALSFIDLVLLGTLLPTIPQSQYGEAGSIVSLIGGLVGLSPPKRRLEPV